MNASPQTGKRYYISVFRGSSSVISGSMLQQHGASSGCGWRNGLHILSELPTRDGPAGLALDEVLTAPHSKNSACYETSHKASD